MKKMKVLSLLLNSTLCVMIIAGIQASAYAITAIATAGPNTPAPNINFTGGCAGTFTLATNNGFIRSKVGFGFNPNVTVQFLTPLVGNCAGYGINGAGIWHLPMSDPNGGATGFQVIDNPTGAVLLRGSFTRAILHGRSGNSSLALTLWQDNVVYDPLSLWFPNWLPVDGLGSLSVAILSRQPVIANPVGPVGGGPQAFQANGDINFGAQ